jgi:hypothetical protein
MSRTILPAMAGVIVIALGLAGCHPAGGAGSSSAAPVQSAAQAQAAAVQSAAPVQAAAAPAGAFQVVLSLSPAAAAKLAGNGQTITVSAEFYGNPISERERMADQGRLDLAPGQDVVITGAGTASFTDPSIDQSKLALVEGGQVEVSIQISSGNHTTQDNSLDCDSYDDQPLQAAKASPVQLHCKLIGES